MLEEKLANKAGGGGGEGGRGMKKTRNERMNMEGSSVWPIQRGQSFTPEGCFFDVKKNTQVLHPS